MLSMITSLFPAPGGKEGGMWLGRMLSKIQQYSHRCSGCLASVLGDVRSVLIGIHRGDVCRKVQAQVSSPSLKVDTVREDKLNSEERKMYQTLR